MERLLMMVAQPLMERNLVPDYFLRLGTRFLLKDRQREIYAGGVEAQEERFEAMVAELDSMPIAINTQEANQQHYEVPTEYYDLALGPRKKYSCCYWPEGVTTLAEAEERSLAQVCERAGVTDGMHILDLGCGWGSLTLYLAEHFPKSRITSLSNSSTQREYIEARCAERGFKNVTVITCDINTFSHDPASFDRVMSIEMFEHMKCYRKLMKRIASWLRPGGRLFVHIFVHKAHPYHFTPRDESDWMARTFFSGGTMPSADLLLRFQDDLVIKRCWNQNGVHYSKTLEAWLQQFDAARDKVMPIMRKVYGPDNATKWLVNHRMFFIACSELFNMYGGNEWFVRHYLFEKPVAGSS